MPCIQLHTSAAISIDQETTIKARLGKAIQVIPGKSEAWLMVTISGSEHIYFKGTNAPAAFVDVSVYGRENAQAFNALTAEICDILNDVLNIASDRIYVKYAATAHWGWNGGNF